MIPFNKPFLSGDELKYIREAVDNGKISGNGIFSKKCQSFFEDKYGFLKVLLTSSCTDALEMAAILCNIGPGDEVIAPSYTFVSTVNAFVLRGADIVFCDVHRDHPCIDETAIAALITSRTKAIVITHYAGIACKMDVIMSLAEKHGLFVIEDAAQAIDSFFKDRPLGGIGHFAAFSFHETKNIIAGEGGMLVVNDRSFIDRAEIIYEKGTDRSRFFRGEIDKYTWKDIGSSFLPSEITAAFLYAQLEKLEIIQSRRKVLWNKYYKELSSLCEEGKLGLPILPAYASNNAHIFYLLMSNPEQRMRMIEFLGEAGIVAVFHYLPLHSSDYYRRNHRLVALPNTDYFSGHLLRIPLYYELSEVQIGHVIECISKFYYAAK
jgi:dTDP-4-amino-4,6-dideoxygalactose transaminase